MMDVDLYHFTCREKADLIEDENFVLVPNQQVFVDAKLVWLTDMDKIDRVALGLDRYHLKCDRGSVMYHVTECLEEPVLWVGSIWHSRVSPMFQAELHRFSDQRRWWVTDEVVRVERVEQ